MTWELNVTGWCSPPLPLSNWHQPKSDHRTIWLPSDSVALKLKGVNIHLSYVKLFIKKPRDWRGFGSIPWHAKTKVRLRFIQTRGFRVAVPPIVWIKENKCVFNKHTIKAWVSCSWQVPTSSVTHLTVSMHQRTILGRKGPWRVPCQLKKPFKGTRQFSCCEEQQRIVFPWFALQSSQLNISGSLIFHWQGPAYTQGFKITYFMLLF